MVHVPLSVVSKTSFHLYFPVLESIQDHAFNFHISQTSLIQNNFSVFLYISWHFHFEEVKPGVFCFFFFLNIPLFGFIWCLLMIRFRQPIHNQNITKIILFFLSYYTQMHMISLCPTLMMFKSVSPLYKYSFWPLQLVKICRVML